MIVPLSNLLKWKGTARDGGRIVHSRLVLLIAILLLAFPVLAQDTAPKTTDAASQPTDPAAKDKAKSTTAGKAAEKKGDSEPGTVATQSRKLDPELMAYAFKSLYFTAIPLAALVLMLMMLLYIGKPDAVKYYEPFFGGGQVTQLVVVIIIAGNVCSLAFAGIMGASEVAAIYGGIIGYILGKQSGQGERRPPAPANGAGKQGQS